MWRKVCLTSFPFFFSFFLSIFTAPPVKAKQDARVLDGENVENKIYAQLEGGVRRKTEITESVVLTPFQDQGRRFLDKLS